MYDINFLFAKFEYRRLTTLIDNGHIIKIDVALKWLYEVKP